MIEQTIIENCIKTIKEQLHLSYETDLFIDFTAKDGLFNEGVERHLVKNALFYDSTNGNYDFLSPDFDFFQFDTTYLSGLWYDDVHVIGCPPYDLAEQCIEVACKFAQSVSFIIPKAAQYAFPETHRLLFSADLIGSNEQLVFQIWLAADC